SETDTTVFYTLSLHDALPISILERELSNSDLIYIYWEQDGKWYAYEQSAFYLSQMMLRVSLGCYVMEDTLWLAKAEVDVSHKVRSEEHTSELQSRFELVCRLL